MEEFKICYILFAMFSILCVTCFIVYKVAMIMELRKAAPVKEFIKTNMDQDFKLLHDVLNQYCTFICEIEFLQNSDVNDTKLINGKQFNEVVDKIYIQVYEALSDEYVSLLQLYLDKFEEYLYQQVYNRVRDFAAELNKTAVKNSVIKDRRKY